MSIHSRCEELLREAEKVLRDADEALDNSSGKERKICQRRRNSLNAACNSLYRALNANR